MNVDIGIGNRRDVKKNISWWFSHRGYWFSAQVLIGMLVALYSYVVTRLEPYDDSVGDYLQVSTSIRWY